MGTGSVFLKSSEFCSYQNNVPLSYYSYFHTLEYLLYRALLQLPQAVLLGNMDYRNLVTYLKTFAAK